MKVAVLDLGTNTFHLVIGEKRYGTIQVLHRDSVFVKIGQGGINEGYLTEAAMKRAYKALKGFQKKVEEMDVFKVVGTATSAIRSAKNGQDFLEGVRQELDFNIRAISGDEEALLIYEGIKTSLEIGEETALMMDIGGGSVEFIIGNQHKVFWKHSFEIGAQRMYDLFHKSEPIEQEGIAAQHRYLNEQLSPLLEAIHTHKVKVLIGSAGSFRTLADIHRNQLEENPDKSYQEHTLSRTDFYQILPKIVESPREERLEIPGMKPERVDMIVVAFSLIDFVLQHIPHVETVRISRGSLREGLLHKTLTVGN